MRDWITVGKEAKEVKAQLAEMLHLIEQRKRAYEAMGALKENLRIMQLLSMYLGEDETEQAEDRLKVVFHLMQTLRLPADE